MAGHQAAAGTLKATLGSRSTRLTEQDYINLIEQGFDSPEALLDARDKSLEAILVRRGAVDAVLAWQAESKPKQHLDISQAERAAERAAERVFKKQRASCTRLQTVLEQGNELLSRSTVAGPCLIDELLGPMPTTNVVSEAASALNNTLGFASGSSEAPVQDAMVSVFQSMHDTQQQQRQPAMLVWDSHAHGLAISGSSSRAKPDLLLCDTFEAPANIVTVVEAKPSLNNRSHAKEAAFQVNQRVQQLRSVQSRRVSWVLAAVGAKAVDIWHMTTQEGQATVCERSGPLPLDANENSLGLQALVRLYCSSPQQLGYLPPGLPPSMRMVDGRLVKPLTRLVPEPDKGYFSLSAADAVLGELGGEEVVMKTGRNVDHEGKMYERLAQLKDKLDLSALPQLSGVVQTSSRTWLVTPYYGRVLGALKNGSQISQATKQVASVIASLADVGLLHGDVSAYNIAVRENQAVLIDLATLRSLQDEATSAACITGTPSFMALSVLKSEPQTVSSDLESLFYSMLYAATSGALHWGQYSHEEAAAYDAKMASMLNAADFETKVVARIRSAELVPIATRLRALFFKDGVYNSNVTPASFIKAFES